MNTFLNNSISFGKLVPTKALLMSASSVHTYQEGKELSMSLCTNFPGHVGYYKKAKILAQQILQKNPHIQNIINDLSLLSKEEKLARINEIVTTLGEKVDVKV